MDYDYHQKIKAIVKAITPVLRPHIDPQLYAIGMLDEGYDSQTHFEVRGLHTLSGNPYTFKI